MSEDDLVNVEGFGDSEYGGGIDTRKAVTRCIIYFMGTPIS